MKTPWIRSVHTALLAAGAAAALAACVSSTQMNGQWRNPNAGKSLPLRSVVVMGIVNDATMRRLYEDTMVAALNARGIKAVQSYLRLPADGPAPQADIERVVKEFGAQSIMTTRLLRVTNETVMSPGMVGPVGPFGWGGFYGMYSGMWGASFAIPPTINTYQNFAIDTRVFEVGELSVLWSGTSTTTPTSSSLQETITEFVKVLVAAMAKDGVV
ncbi:MAG: hypothetical protein ACREBN_05445 [Burkholderiaceae bacterium]